MNHIEPTNRERRVRSLHDGAGSEARVKVAMATPENTGAIGEAVRFANRSAVITDESITPSGTFKVSRARSFVREQSLKFRKRARKRQVVSLKHIDNHGCHTSEQIPSLLPVVGLGDNPISTESTLRTNANVTITFPDATSVPRLDIYRALQQRNRAPTAVTLSNTTLSNGTTTAAYEVGTLLATDLDTCDKFTYSIVGGADAAKFSIGGTNSDRLKLTDGVLNASAKSSYTVTVRVTDFFGQTKDITHVITLAAAQCGDGIDNDGDGKIDYPADPGCSSANDTSENTNALPTAPTLVSPAHNSINVNGAAVTFKWNRATDPDGDTVSYDFYLCTNSSFTNCGPVNVALNELSETQFAGLLGGLGGSGLLIAGLMGAGRAQHKKLKTLLAVAILLSLLGSCGGGGGSGGSGGSGNGGSGNDNTVTHTVTLLNSSTPYFWKVVAKDSNGGSTSSAVYLFTTQ